MILTKMKEKHKVKIQMDKVAFEGCRINGDYLPVLLGDIETICHMDLEEEFGEQVFEYHRRYDPDGEILIRRSLEVLGIDYMVKDVYPRRRPDELDSVCERFFSHERGKLKLVRKPETCGI